MDKINIVSFSTGLSSAVAVERVLQRYGAESTIIVFLDTTIEDDDNYRFMNDCQKRWPQIVKLCDGRNPYQVAANKKIIPNQKIAPCTFELKINVFKKWLKRFPEATIHIGYDFYEVHRCEATKAAYEAEGWDVDFPLLWKPYEFRPYSQVSREDWGIEPPRMYEMGYSHANCGGRCVKQGQGDWLRTLINFPLRYAEDENWEQEMRNHPKRKNYALLRDQSNGAVSPLTLRELRERYEANSNIQLSMLDRNSPCVYCGVGDFITVENQDLDKPC